MQKKKIKIPYVDFENFIQPYELEGSARPTIIK